MFKGQINKEHPAIEKYAKDIAGFIDYRSEIVKSRAMPLILEATFIDKDGNAYLNEKLFIYLLKEIGERVLAGHQITITAKDMLE